ncbi:MAG: Peptide deformylase [Parcubacteria group bacterium GW2011_GWC2_45_7]|nr:MAG: Peptide deformylase [Parcubacteria group bacterium GW2011_GWA2_42_28]KKU13297.1 MAG: Peptide deformylase [Parcubacteria group bacterium GW2011_GWC2_45_7]
MERLENILNRQRTRIKNKNIHSEAHYWADVISNAFYERKRFAMYLGIIKRIGVKQAQKIFTEIKQSDCRSPAKLFVWKTKGNISINMPRILTIIHEPDPILRQRAASIDLSEYDQKDLRGLAEDMVVTMKKAPGVGLAAPQIGKSICLIVVDHTPEPLILINPQLIKHSLRKDILEEGCLSVSGKFGLVKRYKSVKMKALTINGQPFEIEAKGFLAQIFQHEMDHLNGVLFIDKTVKIL